MIDPTHTDYLRSFLSPGEMILPSSKQYRDESLPWAAQKDLKPTLVIRPASIESLSKALAYLSKTDLHLGVRGQGVGSASAKDILISLTAFDEVQWNPQSEIVTIGVGQSWGEYYEKMDRIAPEYASKSSSHGLCFRIATPGQARSDSFLAVSVRTPCVGVGGSILGGGYSWLSAEFGLTSDPANLLDAQVVKVDGTVLWASEDPELLWGLRGCNGGFGGSCLRPRIFH